MKIATKAAILSLALPAALLTFRPDAPTPQPPAPTSQDVEHAVALAHAQAKEAGGRPGRIGED